jgi:hypothetical protein
MLLVTQKTIPDVLQLVKVDYKHKIPNQNPISYDCCLLFCLFHVVGLLG